MKIPYLPASALGLALLSVAAAQTPLSPAPTPAQAPARVAPLTPPPSPSPAAQPVTAQPVTAQPTTAQAAGLALLPDGSRVVCAGNDLLRFSPDGKQVQRRISLRESCLGLQVSPNGTLALTFGRLAAQVWRLADGTRLQTLYMPAAAGRVAFLSDTALLLGTERGLETFDLATGKRVPLGDNREAVSGVSIAPNGERLVIGTAGRVSLVRRADWKVLSGIRCEEACLLVGVQWSRDGRGAVAYAGKTLYSLREGRPVSITLRNLSGDVAGFPLPDNGVWVLQAGRAERRDAQTGRREAVLLTGQDAATSALARATTWNASGGLLFLTPDLTLVELGPDGKEVGRQKLAF